MTMCLRFLFSFVLAVCLFFAGEARADEPSAADKETARSLMDRGDELTEKGDRQGALEAYEGAWSVVHVPTTGAAVARTLAALGRHAEAKRVAEEVLAIPAKPNEAEAFVSARNDAKRIVSEAVSKVGKLTVSLAGVSGGESVTVSLDGKQVSSTQLLQGYEVDAGDHVITATAGDKKAEAKVTLAAGEQKSVTLELAAAERQPVVAKPEPSRGSKKTLGLVIGGIGVVGLATAGVTGAMLLSRDQKIKDNCPNKECNPEGRDLIDGNKSLFAINAVAWGVGVVGVGVGAYLVLSSKSGSETPTETALAPTLLPGGAGLALGRSF